jgi:dihydroorotate dehydrogenase electron transfer subunit
VSAGLLGRRRLVLEEVRRVGPYTLLEVDDRDAPAPTAGQFAMLASATEWGGGTDERPYLARACSYARHDGERALFLLEDVGPGTRRLCELVPGEALEVLGPLGRGFCAPEDGRRAILVGGGVGIAPLLILLDQLLASPTVLLGSSDQLVAPPTVLLGFRDAHHALGAELLDGALVCTDDASSGRGGLVTEPLLEELAGDPHAVVYACGPTPMLEAVRRLCLERSVPAQLALESGMACGFGACFGCVVPAAEGGYLRVCVDGPVLDAARLGELPVGAGAPA